MAQTLSSSDVKPLNRLCKDLENFGITYFSYGLIKDGSVIRSCFSNQKWGDYYLEREYKKIDPLFNWICNSHYPLIFWGDVQVEGTGKEVMFERMNASHLKSGLTLGTITKNATEIIAFGSANSQSDFYRMLKENKYINELQQALKQFYSTYTQQPR